MEKELPPWLNSEFLVTVLKEGDESREVEVVTFSAKLALPPGDNFTSHIFRVKVEYIVNGGPVEVTSLMVKAPITSGIIEEMQSKVDLFAAEPQVYRELLPRLKKKINCDFGPKSYPCPGKGMVLQDLKEDGFTLSDRLNQLDFPHCKLALTTLAKFHAASVACFHDDPEFVRDIGEERLYHNSKFLDDLKLWFSSAITNVGQIIKESEGYEKVGDYFLERTNTLVDSIVEICKPREGHLNVLNHGDLWMSNMLFKHDDSGKVVDVKFVDFQIVRYASPALDVLYFIYTSANEEARSRQRELLDAYLQTFNSCLESLGCEERLSSEDFDEEIKRCTAWAVLTVCNVLPIVLCDPNNVMNMENVSEEDFKKQETFHQFTVIYKSKRLKEELPKIAKHFQNEFLSSSEFFGHLEILILIFGDINSDNSTMECEKQ